MPSVPSPIRRGELAGKIDAIATDLDGTVINTDLGRVSCRTQAALRRCMERGLQVIVCTGRSPTAAEAHRADIGASGPMVYSNGAQIVDMPARNVLEMHEIDTAAARYCNDVAKKHGIYFQVFFTDAKTGAEFIVTENTSHLADFYRNRTKMTIRTGALDEALAAKDAGLSHAIKGLFLVDDEDAGMMPGIRDELLARLDGVITPVRSWPTFLEILPGGLSKGAGLRSALRFRGLSPERVIAFGDEENDISLLRAAGLSGAPANARDTVKDAATWLLGDCDEDGVAAFLETALDL